MYTPPPLLLFEGRSTQSTPSAVFKNFSLVLNSVQSFNGAGDWEQPVFVCSASCVPWAGTSPWEGRLWYVGLSATTFILTSCCTYNHSGTPFIGCFHRAGSGLTICSEFFFSAFCVRFSFFRTQHVDFVSGNHLSWLCVGCWGFRSGCTAALMMPCLDSLPGWCPLSQVL